MGDSAPKMLQVPPDERYIVPNGRLLFHPNRDGRHPYLYAVETHPLDQRTEATLKGRAIVFIQDTSPEGLQNIQDFEDTLCIPLGPDNTIPDLGMYIPCYLFALLNFCIL
jgi:hypothetical protein